MFTGMRINACFGGADRYFTPFVVATFTRKVKTREKMDILPHNNAGTPLVPQILSNNAEEFLATARYMADFGYPEVNLNLGCPMATVVNKHKGSGFLRTSWTRSLIKSITVRSRSGPEAGSRSAFPSKHASA